MEQKNNGKALALESANKKIAEQKLDISKLESELHENKGEVKLIQSHRDFEIKETEYIQREKNLMECLQETKTDLQKKTDEAKKVIIIKHA